MPDIHWRVGEDAEQETIAKTSSPRRSRRSWIMVLIVVVLGAGLGAAYRAIPEPPPRPMSTLPPTPTPPAMPAQLAEAIDREARALAAGDVETILAAHVPEHQAYIDWKRTTIESWGYPADNEPLYKIIAFNLPTSTQAWADIRQFRSGRFFRETRFYLLNKDRWLRTWVPDTSFWAGEEETLHMPHFKVIYAAEDRELIPVVVNQLEADYISLCRDLGCASAGHEMTFTVKWDADTPRSYFTIGESSEFRLPSPRFMGFFESGRVYDWNHSGIDWTLVCLMVQRVAYGEVNLERPGQIILYAIATWAIEHIDSLSVDFRSILGDVNQQALLPLDELWEKPDASMFDQAYAQAYMLMRFIEQEFGAPAIAHLLAAIGPAQSFSEAIEKGLGIPFAEFDLKWQIWTKKILTPLT